MTSSWRSGRVISRTVWRRCGSEGTSSAPASAASAIAIRRRRTEARGPREGARRRRVDAACVLIGSDWTAPRTAWPPGPQRSRSSPPRTSPGAPSRPAAAGAPRARRPPRAPARRHAQRVSPPERPRPPWHRRDLRGRLRTATASRRPQRAAFPPAPRPPRATRRPAARRAATATPPATDARPGSRTPSWRPRSGRRRRRAPSRAPSGRRPPCAARRSGRARGRRRRWTASRRPAARGRRARSTCPRPARPSIRRTARPRQLRLCCPNHPLPGTPALPRLPREWLALLLVVREDVLGEPERRDVVQIAGLARAARLADGVLLERVGGLAALAALDGLVAEPLLAVDALDGQRQAPALGVDLEDLDLDLVARRDDLARVLDVVAGQLGDVHQALDAVEDLDEGAEGDDLGDLALELVADVVGVDDPLPRVLLGLLEAQGDALAVAVDVEHLDLDLLADLEHLARVVDVRPRELGDVDEAVDAVEVDEGAEVDDVGDLALDDVARVQAVEDALAVLAALLLEHRAAREHDVVARPVELDDLALDLLRHVLVEVGYAPDVDERGGQEAAHPEVDDQATLDDLHDRRDDRLARLRRGLDPPPGALEASALLGHDEAAVLVLLGEGQRVDLLAELDLVVRVDRLADGKLVGGDDPLALVADVDEDFIVVDAHDTAGDDLALLEGGEGGVVVRDDLPVDLEQEAVGALDDLGVRGQRSLGDSGGHERPTA